MQAARICLIRFTQDANTDKKKQNAIFQGTLWENTHCLVTNKESLYFTQVIPFPFYFLTEQIPIHKKTPETNQML